MFQHIRSTIDEKENQMIKEIEDKIDHTNKYYSKKLDTLSDQINCINELENMMNIHIEETMKSKISFLNS
jgi:hypothetical protein